MLEPGASSCVGFDDRRMLNETHAAFHENERRGKRFRPDR